VLAAKAALREEVWAALTAAHVARFPGAAGRIPNFTGAETAAGRLRERPEWQQAPPRQGRRVRRPGVRPRQRRGADRPGHARGHHGARAPGAPGRAIPVTGHDIPVDLVVTPERIIDCRPGRGARPAAAICWPELTEDKIAAIPLLTALRVGG